MIMEKVKIGCDTEFMIGVPDSERIIYGETICSMNGHIGTDMHGDQMELRPHPSENTLDVVTNIRSILRLLVKENPKLKSLAFIGGHFHSAPIGGHIHIRPIRSATTFGDDWNEIQKHPVVKLLDLILFHGLATVIDDAKGRAHRRQWGYGKMSDVRESGENGIEYRTPPCWLVHPTLTFLYLCLAKICALLELNKSDYSKTYDIIIKSKVKGMSLLSLLADRIANIPSLVKEEDIRMCVKILRNLRRNKLVIDWKQDFKKAWGL